MIDLATLVALSAAGGLLLVRTDHTRRLWLHGTAWAGAVVAVMAVAFPDPLSASLGRLAVEGSNTIATGRALGATSVALLGMALFKTGRVQWWFVAGGVASLGVLVGTASRGPAVAAVVSLVVVAFVTLGRRLLSRRVLVKVALPVAAVAAAAVWLAVQLGVVSAHLLTLGDKSSNARVVLYEKALHEIVGHPLGIGWGGFDGKLFVGKLIPAEPWVLYPHNILLEVTGEAGWLAGIALVVVLVIGLRRTLRPGLPPTVVLTGGLLVFFTLNALVSGDVNDNRGLWVALGAALAVPSSRRAASGTRCRQSPRHQPQPASTP
jgi:O-antigen ligase